MSMNDHELAFMRFIQQSERRYRIGDGWKYKKGYVVPLLWRRYEGARTYNKLMPVVNASKVLNPVWAKVIGKYATDNGYWQNHHVRVFITDGPKQIVGKTMSVQL